MYGHMQCALRRNIEVETEGIGSLQVLPLRVPFQAVNVWRTGTCAARRAVHISYAQPYANHV